MRPFPTVLLGATGLTLASISLPVLADECVAKIVGMFVGGPLDAYQRPAHRDQKQVTDAGGNITITFQSIVQTPMRTISGVKDGDMTMAIDDDTWTEPGPDGPWVPSENNMPKDRKPWHIGMQGQQAKNLTETECGDGVVLDG